MKPAILLLSAAAYAGDPPATETENTTETTVQDCTRLEGEEKTKCEEAAKKAAEATEEKKGGKAMTKSNDNRMESMDADE